ANYLRNISSEAKLKLELTKLKDELNALKTVQSETIFFETFDIVVWIESKLENKPMLEIVKTLYPTKTEQDYLSQDQLKN
ncbi:MAG: hypothetical protein J0M08_02930, partial [Bacteroidetes bacterium]|nr:hypothetical protein [Bacteroidota bacterium]